MTVETLKRDIESCFDDLDRVLDLPGFMGKGNLVEVIQSYFSDSMYIGKLERFCELRVHSSDHYNHSLRVGILSWMALKKIDGHKRLKKKKLAEFCAGGILHDARKLNVKKETLEKKGKLDDSEKQEMRNHPYAKDTISYILRGKNGVNKQLINYMAETHHNDIDGNGYGALMSVKRFNGFAQLVAIADSMDAILCRGIYQEKRTPAEVENYLDLISTEKNKKSLIAELTKQVSKITNDDGSRYFKNAEPGRFERKYAEPYMILLRNYVRPGRT